MVRAVGLSGRSLIGQRSVYLCVCIYGFFYCKGSKGDRMCVSVYVCVGVRVVLCPLWSEGSSFS